MILQTSHINFVNVIVFNSVTSPHELSCRKSKLCKKKLYIAALTSNAILVPRGCAPFGQHQEWRPLAWTSGQVQHRKSAIYGLPVTLRMLRVKSDKFNWFWSQSIVSTKPFKTGMVSILGADQKERSLWGRECSNAGHLG